MEISDIADFPQVMIDQYADDLHKIKIPQGWRLIKPGEILKKGDIYWSGWDDQWKPVIEMIRKPACVASERTLCIAIRNVWFDDTSLEEQVIAHYDNSGDWS